MIPFLDLKQSYFEIKEEIDRSLLDFLSKGRYILGDEVSSFEEEWAFFCDSKYCCSLGNGLDALVLSLKALSIGKGDEVIVPAHTFIATWLAVSIVGAKPIPIDVKINSFHMDVTSIQSRINSNTKAIKK